MSTPHFYFKGSFAIFSQEFFVTFESYISHLSVFVDALSHYDKIIKGN